LYIITFGGGLVEGDNVCVDVKVGELSTVVVTTQASTKVCYTARAILYQISSKKLRTYFLKLLPFFKIFAHSRGYSFKGCLI